MRGIKLDNNGQMLIIESVLFAIMIFMALFFVYQLSPTPATSADISSDQLKIIGDDALRAIDNSPPESPGAYHNSKLVKFIANNEVGNFTSYLDTVLPDYVGYNIYLSGTSLADESKTATDIWYDGEYAVFGDKIGNVAVCHILIVVSNDLIWPAKYGLDGSPSKIEYLLDDVKLPVIEVVLEMWYI